jgi:5-methyltetrahydropteroyltriglutamate--homocysteine methyltransferase
VAERSTDRILTTHVGSLPRSDEVVEAVLRTEQGQAVDAAAFEGTVRAAMGQVVRRQLDAGIDVINDGEQSKFRFSSYQWNRLSGLELREAPPGRPVPAESADYPEFYERWTFQRGDNRQLRAVCVEPISYTGLDELRRDIGWLKEATAGVPAVEVFMTAISPATAVRGLPNEFYRTTDELEIATAEALKVEYDAIFAAGLLLQVDCPDFGVTPRFAGTTPAEHRKQAARNVALLNHATRDIPPEKMRFHVCWGADEAPHHRDVPLADMVDLLLQARPEGMTVVGSNGRHEWEWQVWRDVRLPDGKVLIPGVIDSTTNIIEHPETVADRIVRYAEVVGRDNLIAGVDCGLDTVAGIRQVDPEIAWAKLAALAEGARLASRRLWRSR